MIRVKINLILRGGILNENKDKILQRQSGN